MTQGPVRRAALAVGRLLRHVFPAGQSPWAQAMLAEIHEVPGDRQALLFALGCLKTALLCAVAGALRDPYPPWQGANDMTDSSPDHSGIVCAVAATALGLFYLAMAGAGAAHLVVNAGALVLGLAALALGAGGLAARSSLPALLLALALLATAALGASAEGATRWVRIGPLAVQVGLVVLPVIVLGYARRGDGAGGAAVAIAALALALQPDRAMAGALAASLAALAMMKRERLPIALAAIAATAFIVTLAKPDPLPASPFVDRILHSAFDLHWLAGLAVWTGAVLLFVPALIGAVRDPVHRHVHVVFGLMWAAILVAAALGNYPTPVVGYGGSAILGYVLGLALLPGARRHAASAKAERVQARNDSGGASRRAVAPGRHALAALRR